MIGSDIAKRYAKALFEIARDENRIEGIYEEMSTFLSVLEQNKNLKDFFANPIFSRSDKKAVMIGVLEKTGISGTTANFLKLLVEKRRVNALEGVEAYYQKYMDDVMNKARVMVRTPFPLSDTLSRDIKKKLESLTGKNVEMVVEDDPSLLGGVVVKVGDTQYDGTIRARLSSIRELIREEI